MTKTEMTGRTCVGAVRLAPIDVGFDVRLHDMAVEVPRDATSAGYERGGQTWLVEGARDEIVAELVAAGYRVAPAG